MVIITIKKGVIHMLALEKGEDFLYALDKFLKRDKLALSSIKRMSITCENKESMQYRIVSAIVSGLHLI